MTGDTPGSRWERLLGSTEPVRRALYPVVVAVVALLVAYGLLDAERVPLWLALAVAILGPGSIEAARAVAWAPATVRATRRRHVGELDDTYARGWRDALDHAARVVHDEPGAHAEDRLRAMVDTATAQLEAQDAPTGLIAAPVGAGRCREVEGRRRCVLARQHAGPHHMSTG